MALESKVAQSVYENSVFVSWVNYTFKPEEQKLLVTENKNLLVDRSYAKSNVNAVIKAKLMILVFTRIIFL